jgi:glucosamine-6-phosphate deaminase
MKHEGGKTPLRIFESPAALGASLAEELVDRIDRARQAGKNFLLGCPTGRTPRPVYEALARQFAKASADISHVRLVMMDEYVVRSGDGFDYAPADAPWSCHYFVRAEIADRWNRDLPRAHRLRDDAFWFPDPNDPVAYDKRISAEGGIDFFVLASGVSDGHVAFNPPGSARESRTRIIKLPESTRKDNLQTFPAFGSLTAVPTHGISVGIATIAAAKEAVMLLWGTSKAKSLARILAADRYDSAWPATVIHECARARILCDADAAANQ